MDLRPERPILRIERPDRSDLRLVRPNLRPMGGTNKQTNQQTDEQKSPCVLHDFVPFGAAAQKRLNIQPSKV